MKPSFELEKKYISLGYKYIAGVDEVGRGALAGPLLASAVIFDITKIFNGLGEIRDSKKLSANKREKLSKIIITNCITYSYGEVSATEIDKIGISMANVLAFNRALERIKIVDFVLIDGREIKNFDYKHKCIIKGDNKSISIAAASIIAKVKRDKIMKELKDNSIYQFENHVGYGTKVHIELIKQYGKGENHRESFLKKILEK